MAPPAHRLPKALLIAAVTALVLGGVIGGVQAAHDPTSAATGDDGTLDTPRPAVGDKWTYQILVTGGGWNFADNDSVQAGSPSAYAEFGWEAPKVVRDGEGNETAVDVLHVRRLDYHHDPRFAEPNDDHLWVPEEEHYFFRLGTTEDVAHEAFIESQEQDQGGVTVAGSADVEFLPGQTEQVEGWARYYGFTHAPCFGRTLLQGEPFDLDQAMPVSPDCLPRFPDGEEDVKVVGGGPYRFVARETVAGHLALRFDAEDASLWLSEEFPIPIQWTAKDGGNTATVTLSTFQPGADPLGTLGPVEGTTTAPAVVMAPRQLWGPDDSGVDHPFPASAAFQAAQSDPQWPTLRTWLATHPGAAPFLLEYSEDLQSVPQQRSWFFALTDDGSIMAFVAQQSAYEGSPLPAVVRFQDLSFWGTWLAFLAPSSDAIPPELPTVASVTARWQAYETLEGRDPTPNGWGMGLWCVLDCGYGLYGDVVAGRDPVAFMHWDLNDVMVPGVSIPDVGERTFTGAQLNVGPDGETHALVNWTGYAQGLTGAALAGQPAVDPATEPAPAKDRPLAFATFVPTPEQGAAITLASALAGLLYWLWPSLKGGAAGLFSRLSGPQLLEHPARAKLVQIVQAEPGIHFQDLVRRAGIPNGTAVHHLGKLTKDGLLSARALGRYTCYFPGSSPDRASLARAPVLRSEGARRVYEAIQGQPGLSGLELAHLVGLQPSTVNYHVQKLVECGLVLAARQGRSVRLSAAAAS
jgi:DNA-binding transcriptional ArsR family regulator